jgi:broad specificity phosphatase PhoE
MKTTFYLARHGETQWNKQQRFQGRLDSPLTELGILQSKDIVSQLNEKKVDLIVSSTLGRAVASAALCQQLIVQQNPHINSEKNSGLIERDLGDWQGKYLTTLKVEPTYAEVFQQFTHTTPNKGESAMACGERINQALTLLAEQWCGKSMLVVFHGEALRCFLALLGQSSKENAYDLFANGSLFTLHYQHSSSTFQLS